MSEEIMQKSGDYGSDLKSMLVFPATTTAAVTGFGALSSVRRARGIKKALSELEVEKFARLNKTLKGGLNNDVFLRGRALSENYEALRTAQKSAYKANKGLNKIIKKSDLTLKEKFFNLFKSSENKLTFETKKVAAEKINKKAASELAEKTASLAVGKEIVEHAGAGGFKNTAKNLFKKEMSNKFNLGMSVLTTFIPAVKEKVIPAFKNEGILAGLKETGKAVLKTGSDFVSYGLGGALGRTAGYALGALWLPSRAV